MAEILKSITKPELHATGFIDLAGMLLVKRLVDRAAVPIVGNNNIISGAAKAVLGGIAYHSGGRAMKILGGGIALDGFDDFVGVIVGKIWGGSSSDSANAAVNPGL